ncbi:beta-ketoacyl synthase chain length factor [Selenomonas sp.]|uniref:beta-ketoacyl synthase chain length factor n=1 Tax=Selenomonas sp. TaxID=2053611 RepID=UPI003FA232D4
MTSVYIDGIGILSPSVRSKESLIAAAEELAESDAAAATPAGDVLAEAFEFPLGVPASKVRRAPRYAKLAVAAAAQALADAGVEADHAAVGTIFTSGYGPVENNVTFADSVADGAPLLASPTVFSYTVPNACLGQVCIVHGLQGPSTMLLAGDAAEYAALLLAGGKAPHILCGAVEDPTVELRASFDAAGALSAEKIAGGAVTLLLSAKASAKSYCRITKFASAALPVYPYVSRLSDAQGEAAVRAMTAALAYVRQDAPPDLVLTAENGGGFDAKEQAARREALGDVRALCPKRIFGESLNCGYLENIALGAALLRGERERGGKIRSIVATGLDVHGNYLAARMEV